MSDHHEHVPGKAGDPKKPEQGHTPDPSKKTSKPEQPDESAHTDKAAHHSKHHC